MLVSACALGSGDHRSSKLSAEAHFVPPKIVIAAACCRDYAPPLTHCTTHLLYFLI